MSDNEGASILLDDLADEYGVNADQLQQVVNRMAMERGARAYLEMQAQADAPMAQVELLSEMEIDPASAKPRVAGLIPWEANTMIIARRKAGKTTFVLNLAYSLITGEPFLDDAHEVIPIEPGNRIALMNYEMPKSMILKWAEDVGIDKSRVVVINSRGMPNPLASPRSRKEYAEQLKALNVEAIIIDPFANAAQGVNQDNNTDVRTWISHLDEFTRGMVGARDVILCVHAGHEREGQMTRVRGASTLEDWADCFITMNYSDKTEQRTIEAKGRDVNLTRRELTMDPHTRRLTTGQITRDERLEFFVRTVAEVVGMPQNNGCNQKALDQAVAERCRDAVESGVPGAVTPRKGEVSKAAVEADRRHLIRRVGGGKKGASTAHYPPSELTRMLDFMGR